MWQYNYTPNSDDIMHYGVIGMRWGHRKAKAGSLKSSNKSTKKPISNNTVHKDLKKATKSGQKKTKKILSKNSGKAVKAIGKSAKLGLSMARSLYNISDTGFENRQMQTYANLASQMSPEYRRRFMYD